jgi:hypothetical protein
VNSDVNEDVERYNASRTKPRPSRTDSQPHQPEDPSSTGLESPRQDEQSDHEQRRSDQESAPSDTNSTHDQHPGSIEARSDDEEKEKPRRPTSDPPCPPRPSIPTRESNTRRKAGSDDDSRRSRSAPTFPRPAPLAIPKKDTNSSSSPFHGLKLPSRLSQQQLQRQEGDSLTRLHQKESTRPSTPSNVRPHQPQQRAAVTFATDQQGRGVEIHSSLVAPTSLLSINNPNISSEARSSHIRTGTIYASLLQTSTSRRRISTAVLDPVPHEPYRNRFTTPLRQKILAESPSDAIFILNTSARTTNLPPRTFILSAAQDACQKVTLDPATYAQVIDKYGSRAQYRPPSRSRLAPYEQAQRRGSGAALSRASRLTPYEQAQHSVEV